LIEHSNLTKLLAYTCAIILTPIFIGGSFGYPYIMITNDVSYELGPLLLLIVICIALAFYCMRVFYLLMRFLTTLNHKVEYDDIGITLYQNSHISKFTWDKLAKSKSHKDCQIFCLIDESGSHLMSIWELANNYSDFRDKVAEELGI
jgi:hypothetical protein